jgi:hypothetical protein
MSNLVPVLKIIALSSVNKIDINKTVWRLAVFMYEEI